jgi:hypothetical protein
VDEAKKSGEYTSWDESEAWSDDLRAELRPRVEELWVARRKSMIAATSSPSMKPIKNDGGEHVGILGGRGNGSKREIFADLRCGPHHG